VNHVHIAAALLVVPLGVAATPAAHATHEQDPRCPPQTEAWAARCQAKSGYPVTAEGCPEQRLLLAMGGAEGVLGIELRKGTEGFRTAGGVVLQPIGEFPKWEAEAAWIRDRLEAAVACAAAEDPAPLLTLMPIPVPRPGPGGVERVEPTDWSRGWGFAILGIALLAATLAPRAARRVRLAELGLAAGCALAAFVYWSAGFEGSFVHQNGHGAQWVEYALCDRSPYGPGFQALFAAPAWLAAPAAEEGVFCAQRALGALGIGALYGLVRLATGRRAWGIGAALALAAHPLVARMASSESYFAAELALLSISAAGVALAARDAACWRRSLRPHLSGLSAGLAAGLACAMHPVGWVTAALCPSIAVLGGGTRKEVLTRLLVAGVSYGLALSLVAGATVLEILTGEALAQWLPPSTGRAFLGLLPWLVAPTLAALALPRNWGAGLAALVLVAAARDLEGQTNRLQPELFLQRAAWTLLFLPPLLAGLGTALRPILARSRWLSLVAVAPVALSVGDAALGWERWTTLPTDALESRLLTPALRSLPARAVLYAPMLFGKAIQLPPLYSNCLTGVRVRGLDLFQPPTLTPGAYYYRTSLCSMADAGPLCAAVESGYQLEPLQILRLPARPSLHYTPYQTSEVEVGLYRVLGTAHRDSP
jgi:hypothetical protein